MTPAIAGDDVRDYLEAVRLRLADLAPEEREHLLSDTEASLLAAAEEASDLPLDVRLGPPERFAAELRIAAGLPAAAPEAVPATPRSLRERLAELREHPRARRAARLAREFAPAWWLARAYIVLAAAVILLRGPFSDRHPAVPVVFGSATGTAIALAALVAASVWLGRRERGRAALALNLVVLAAALPVAEHATESGPAGTVQYIVESAKPPGILHDGSHVQNIYPYSRDGKLLQDVLLYDDLGRPLDVRRDEGDPLRRTPVTEMGQPLFNAFPIRYFEPGTRTVADPDAGAPKGSPAIATPPLRSGPAKKSPKRRNR